MLISETIGGLPILSKVYDYGPLWAAIIVFIADYGVICGLMLHESRYGALPPWKRTFYKTFKWNDTVWIPLIMAMAAVILEDAPRLEGWYTSTWWHIFLLAIGFAISLYTEYDALTGSKRQYTWAQELAPSKLWHTLIFGIVFYWLLSALVPVIVVHRPVWAMLLLVIGVGFVFRNMYLDATLPIPHTAHPEWDWDAKRATTRWK